MRKGLPGCGAILLAVLGTSARAQTTVRQVEIKSGWGGLGAAQSADLVIKRRNGEYRLNGERIDSARITRLVAALREPAARKPDANSLGITPKWCRENAARAAMSEALGVAEAAPNQKNLYSRSFNDPVVIARVVRGLFEFTQYDDYPGASVTVTFADGSTLEANSRSYYAFMLPWEIGRAGSATYNAQISRAVAALMPEGTVNRHRLAGEDFAQEFAEAVMQHIETAWKLLDAENKAGGALARLRKRYRVVRAEINQYHDVNYGVDWEGNKPHETNLHVTVRRAGFPGNLSDEVVLRMNGSQIEGVDRFMKGASEYEDLVQSSPLFREYIRRHPRTPVWISYVHDASFGDKAMRIFAADMHAIGKDDVVPAVQAQQSHIALVTVGEAFWLMFPDKHLLLWRFDGPKGLLRWKPETFPFRRCSDYHPVWGGCVGSEVSADGKQAQDYASSDPCAPAPGTPPRAGAPDEPLFPVHKGGKAGFINARGELAIQLRFDVAGDFSEGLARVECAGRWGFIDPTGNWVVRPRFPWAHDFSEGFARVQLAGEALAYDARWAFIDKSGTVVIRPVATELPSLASEADDFHEGLAVIEVNLLKGFIDRTGKIIIPPKFYYVSPFSEGLAAVAFDWRGDLFGFIDKSGQLVIPAKFQMASQFAEGLAPVKGADSCGFIDHSGTFVLQLPVAEGERYCMTGQFSEGLASSRFGRLHGFIDRTGKTVIQPQFDMTLGFSEGLAAVRVDKKWGFIDKTGRMVIEPREYHHVDSFKHGVAQVVTEDGKWGYIDRTGKYLWEPTRQSED